MLSICRNFASLFAYTMGIVVLIFLSMVPQSASSHEIKPTIVDFKVTDAGKYALDLNLNLESWLANIGEEHSDTADSPNAADYDRLRALSPEQITELFEKRVPEFIKALGLKLDEVLQTPRFDTATIDAVGDVDLARTSNLHFSGELPSGALNVSWSYKLGASVFRVENRDGKTGELDRVSTYVKAGATSDQIGVSAPQQRSRFSSFLEYMSVGFDHIIPKGLDHILFVVGLFLLSTRLSPLLWQITSFTIAHTVTLGLGMAGLVSIPGNIVEPLIAASIVYVAVENIFMDRLSPWRPVVVFFFGLLHGLGFAGVLKEFGLGTSNFVAGLIGFNVGVEIGQLTVIAVCFALVGYWFGKKPWYHQRVTIPGSIAIALIGAWWFYQRTVLA